MSTKQPNFLFITTDQQRADQLGCYGNDIVQTPSIDALASRGIVFDSFYVACPICMPNRVAILTGRMPTTNGTRHNGIPLPLDAVTFVDVLRADGYHTGLIGKAHFQNITGHEVTNGDIFDRHHPGKLPPDNVCDAFKTQRSGKAYEAELMPLWQNNPYRNEPRLPYYGFDYVRFANGHSDHVQGHYTAWLAEKCDDPDSLRGADNALSAPDLIAPQSWRTAMPESLYPTTFIEETTRDFIDLHMAERSDDPFFVHCSFTDPHHPFTPPGKYFDMYDPSAMPLPASFHHIDPNEPEMLTRLRREYASDQAKTSGPLPFCTGEEETRQILALTYGMISMVDDAVGRLIAHLEHHGLLENTVVIFTSDHGDFMGDHSLMLKHGLHFEGVLRVPFIWADPNIDEAQRSDIKASSIDISTSVLARAGLAPNNGNQGVDIITANNAASAMTARQGVLIEEDELGDHLGTESGLRTRTFIQDSWRITIWQGMPDGQLYERKSDPQELRNLWLDERYADKKADLLEAMLREIIRLGDTAPYATHIA